MPGSRSTSSSRCRVRSRLASSTITSSLSMGTAATRRRTSSTCRSSLYTGMTMESFTRGPWFARSARKVQRLAFEAPIRYPTAPFSPGEDPAKASASTPAGFCERSRPMRENIHPAYPTAKVHCACGATWETRSTHGELHLDICSNCHPFFTGKQKLMDTEGRIDRFKKKYANAPAAPVKKKAAPPKAAPKAAKPKDKKPAKKTEKSDKEPAAKA